MHHEDQEIVRHGIIGGLVAVALVALHRVAESLTQTWSASATSYAYVRIIAQMIGWLVIFVSVFAVILITEQYIRRLQWKARIRLDGVGYVDGQWIQVTVIDGDIKSAGILEISSAAGEGFRMNGVAYQANAGGATRQIRGHWRSIQGLPVGQRDVAYVFEGTAEDGDEQFGAGFYRFTPSTEEADLALEGSFLIRQGKSARHEIGRRISRSSPLPANDAFSILSDYVKTAAMSVALKQQSHSGSQ